MRITIANIFQHRKALYGVTACAALMVLSGYAWHEQNFAHGAPFDEGLPASRPVLTDTELVVTPSALDVGPAPAPARAWAESVSDVLAPLVANTPTETRLALPVPVPDARAVRLLIPSAHVNAPIETLGVAANQSMAAPTTPDAVAWYDFSARPGFGDPAVFAGHYDWQGGAPAVFAHLSELGLGDSILIQLSDGMLLRYHVTSSQSAPESTPLLAVIGSRRGEPLVLITCEGKLDQTNHRYDRRRIVRAERAPL